MAQGSERLLIVCADDFGMSAGVNEGVVRAHRAGILTDASLMVGGEAFEAAVALAHRYPTLSVGLHLALVQGRPTANVRAIPDLVGTDGMLERNPVKAGLRSFFLPRVRAQVQVEIEAQLQRFLSTGVPLSHVDGHLNIHLHPTVLNVLLRLADHYGIRALRLTREPIWPALRFDGRHVLRKLTEGMIFRVLSRHAARCARRHLVRHPDRLFGLHQSGRLSESYLLWLLPQLGPGVNEIYCHPGLPDAESQRWRPRDYDPEQELEALTSSRVRAMIEQLGIKLTNYRVLASPDSEEAVRSRCAS